MQHTVEVRRPPALLAALALALLAACSDDGRTLAPPRPDQTTTSATVPVTVGADAEGATFSLASEGIDDGGELPRRHTCSGDGRSPALSWTGTPAGTSQLAIVVRDRDADGFVHWLVTGIDPSTEGFGEGGLPEVAVEQVNSTGAIGWHPPCPPDDERHVYDIVLHALPEAVDIDPALPAADAAAAVEATSTAQAALALSVTASATGAGSADD